MCVLDKLLVLLCPAKNEGLDNEITKINNDDDDANNNVFILFKVLIQQPNDKL
jgi:hypothetical protein